MRRETDSMAQSDALLYTYIWLGIYGVAAFVFFGIALWVIFQGGKDVIEILTAEKKD